MNVARIVCLFLFGMIAGVVCAAPASSPDAEQSVRIDFELLAGGKPMRCESPAVALGSGRVPARLHDARFYVAQPELIDARGAHVPVVLDVNEWQLVDLALLDFENGTAGCHDGTGATHTTLTGRVPAGQYTGLAFLVGVPERYNHSSTEASPPPLDLAALSWSWQAGRKFMKIELDPQGGVDNQAPNARSAHSATWYLHLGSTDCSGNPAAGESVSCRHPNRFHVQLMRFNAAKDRVALDLDALFGGSDLTVNRGGPVGCMSGLSDPECPALFERLGLHLVDSAAGAGDAGRQVEPGVSKAFRVVEQDQEPQQ